MIINCKSSNINYCDWVWIEHVVSEKYINEHYVERVGVCSRVAV